MGMVLRKVFLSHQYVSRNKLHVLSDGQATFISGTNLFSFAPIAILFFYDSFMLNNFRLYLFCLFEWTLSQGKESGYPVSRDSASHLGLVLMVTSPFQFKEFLMSTLANPGNRTYILTSSAGSILTPQNINTTNT